MPEDIVINSDTATFEIVGKLVVIFLVAIQGRVLTGFLFPVNPMKKKKRKEKKKGS